MFGGIGTCKHLQSGKSANGPIRAYVAYSAKPTKRIAVRKSYLRTSTQDQWTWKGNIEFELDCESDGWIKLQRNSKIIVAK